MSDKSPKSKRKLNKHKKAKSDFAENEKKRITEGKSNPGETPSKRS